MSETFLEVTEPFFRHLSSEGSQLRLLRVEVDVEVLGLQPLPVELVELDEARKSGTHESVEEELGDLLFQIIFYGQIASERQLFDLNSIIHRLVEKLIRRHPHVFQEGELHTPEQVVHQWEEIKKKEKINATNHSILDNIPKELPSLLRAQKLQKKAAKHYPM